jgi:hypothetical protein
MDPKIPKQLKAYIKKARASRKKENKLPTQTQKQTSKQQQIVIINQGKESKSKRKRRVSTRPTPQPSRNEYPSIVYQQAPAQPYVNPTYPFENRQQPIRQQPINIFNQQRQDVPMFNQQPQQFPLQPEVEPIFMNEPNFNVREPQPYNFMNPNANILPLNPLLIEDYQVEQNIPEPPIPPPNPILPEIILEPNRVVFGAAEPISPRSPDSPKFYDVIPPPMDSENIQSIPSQPIGFVENAAVNQLNQQVEKEIKAYDDFGGYDAYSPQYSLLSPSPAPVPLLEDETISLPIKPFNENISLKPNIPLPAQGGGGGGGGFEGIKLSEAAKKHINSIDEIEIISEASRTPDENKRYKEAYAYFKKYPPSSETLKYIKGTITPLEYSKFTLILEEHKKKK